MVDKEKPYSLEELLKPRQIFIVNTGRQKVVEKERERFFNSVLGALGYSDEERAVFAEIRSLVLHSYDTQGQVLPTDDRITLLIARNCVVASILETRDDLNYVQVSPASYLNPEMIKGIGEVHK